MINTLLILLILLAVTGIFVWYLRKTDFNDNDEEYDDFITLTSLDELLLETVNATENRSVDEMNLSQEEYNRVSAGKEELRTSTRNAPYGDRNSKYYVLSFAKDVLQNARLGKLNEFNIDRVIPFNATELLKSRDRFELLTWRWLQEHGKNGFSKMFTKYGLDVPKETPYGDEYVVEEEDIIRVYDEYVQEYGEIGYKEQIAFLTQRVYEDTYGNGSVDLLLDTDIDEVQGGVSGIPADSYDVYVEDTENIEYSFESIWIVFKGHNIHLRCTTFGSQRELIRVVRNIYRYNPPVILTKKDAGVIGSMKNGNRITVACPEFADSFVFLARKFDSTTSISPEKLL